tara:strand:- start:414 stop:1232 length:819 start_codon:yes stop_codon:yes gene_type:complete
MNVLELFSGTHSVGKVCVELGWNVVSVDNELPATHEIDILDFNYKEYPKDYFSIVWASPPCTFYSTLQNCWLGQKKADGILFTKEVLEAKRQESDKLIQRTLEIIDYFNPELWCIENPQTGTLKNREIVKGLPYYDVSYCMYSDWGYEKKTRIWTNKKDWKNLICDKSGACGNMIEIPTDGAVRHDTGKPLKCKTRKLHNNLLCKSETIRAIRKHKLNVANDVHTIGEKKKHKKSACGGSSKINGSWVSRGVPNQLDRYRIPPDLIFSLFLD